MSGGDYGKLLLGVLAAALRTFFSFFFFLKLAEVLVRRRNPPLWRLNYTGLWAPSVWSRYGNMSTGSEGLGTV